MIILRRVLIIMALAVLAMCIAGAAPAQVPPRALKYIPVLRDVQREIWPGAPMPEFLAAQVEQESCISLTHPKCWNPEVQLKTNREWGRGLGQVTTAYREDGSVRFDTQEELRQRFTSLRGWTTSRWADPRYQLTAIVEMDKAIYGRMKFAADPREQVGFMLSGYNGGETGVAQDRMLCRNRSGCDPARWFSNVELYSLKSKVAFKGYGKSPFDINREYPRNVLGVRLPKYRSFFSPDL